MIFKADSKHFQGRFKARDAKVLKHCISYHFLSKFPLSFTNQFFPFSTRRKWGRKVFWRRRNLGNSSEANQMGRGDGIPTRRKRKVSCGVPILLTTQPTYTNSFTCHWEEGDLFVSSDFKTLPINFSNTTWSFCFISVNIKFVCDGIEYMPMSDKLFIVFSITYRFFSLLMRTKF